MRSRSSEGCGSESLGIREMGDTKVGDFDGATVGSPEEVGGFDVSMDDALVME